MPQSDAELRTELASLLHAHLAARVGQATQALTNFSSIRVLRREVARVRTILRERDLKVQRPNKSSAGSQMTHPKAKFQIVLCSVPSLE